MFVSKKGAGIKDLTSQILKVVCIVSTVISNLYLEHTN